MQYSLSFCASPMLLMHVSFKSGISILPHSCNAFEGLASAIFFISSKVDVRVSSIALQSALQLYSLSSNSHRLLPQQGSIGLFTHFPFSKIFVVPYLLGLFFGFILGLSGAAALMTRRSTYVFCLLSSRKQNNRSCQA